MDQDVRWVRAPGGPIVLDVENELVVGGHAGSREDRVAGAVIVAGRGQAGAVAEDLNGDASSGDAVGCVGWRHEQLNVQLEVAAAGMPCHGVDVGLSEGQRLRGSEDGADSAYGDGTRDPNGDRTAVLVAGIRSARDVDATDGDAGCWRDRGVGEVALDGRLIRLENLEADGMIGAGDSMAAVCVGGSGGGSIGTAALYDMTALLEALSRVKLFLADAVVSLADVVAAGGSTLVPYASRDISLLPSSARSGQC